MTPQPVRIRFMDSSGAVAGHWFLRPDPEHPEGWKLSFWFRDDPEELRHNRRCTKGTGYTAAMEYLWDRILLRAKQRYIKYKEARADVVEDLADRAPRPGFRPSYHKALRSRLENAWRVWRSHYTSSVRDHIKFLNTQGWPVVTAPPWPWESP